MEVDTVLSWAIFDYNMSQNCFSQIQSVVKITLDKISEGRQSRQDGNWLKRESFVNEILSNAESDMKTLTMLHGLLPVNKTGTDEVRRISGKISLLSQSIATYLWELRVVEDDTTFLLKNNKPRIGVGKGS